MLNKFRKKFEKKLAYFLATKGPYHFLVKKWSDIDDIEVAVKTLGTEFFRDQIRPVSMDMNNYKKILVLAPHQDDETIGAGGTLLKASKLGAEIKVVFITDGAQDNLGCTIEESIQIRKKESQKVGEIINAQIMDMGISNMKPSPNEKDVDSLNKIISDFKPDIIMLPWLLDAPVKHRMVNHLLAIAFNNLPFKRFEIWGYQVHNTLYPNIYVDITDEIDGKKDMISCYESQNYNIQCYDHLCIGMSAWNSRFISQSRGNIKKKYAEVFFSLPSHDYINLVNTFYVINIEKTYKGDKGMISALKDLNSKLNLLTKN